MLSLEQGVPNAGMEYVLTHTCYKGHAKENLKLVLSFSSRYLEQRNNAIFTISSSHLNFLDQIFAQNTLR